MKYNQANGSSALRWVQLVAADPSRSRSAFASSRASRRGADGSSVAAGVPATPPMKICWGDVRSKELKSEASLGDALALLHGAKSCVFFKAGAAKKDQDRTGIALADSLLAPSLSCSCVLA